MGLMAFLSHEARSGGLSWLCLGAVVEAATSDNGGQQGIGPVVCDKKGSGLRDTDIT